MYYFCAALIASLATGLGALPFFFVRNIGKKWISIANATAAGLMLGASFSLISAGVAANAFRTLLGILIGVGFMALIHHLLSQREDLNIGELEGANAIKALIIVGVMTLHSFAEGIGVGLSFGGGETLGA